MSESLKLKVLRLINNSDSTGIELNKILKNFNNKKNILKILENYLAEGYIFKKNEKFFSSKKLNLIRAKITRNFKNYCFAKTLDKNIDFFIPAKFSKNALINDIVLITKISRRFINFSLKNRSSEGKVVAFVKKENFKFTGTITIYNNLIYVKPDDFIIEIILVENNTKNLKNNDKVVAKIDRKNFDFKKPTCQIIKVYGNADIADSCAMAYLKINNITSKFNKKIVEEARYIKKTSKNYNKEEFVRLDLTKKTIFTIDGKNSQDLDDAISVEKFDDFYLIGVHIADVSNFVKFKSKIDIQALKRGNSIYVANKVIPMLCETLSNDLCSLQPNKVRLTFSILIKLDFNCKILEFKLVKTKIKSKIKGIYEEINQIFDNNYQNKSKSKLLKKYSTILPQLQVLKKICTKLKKIRIKNGIPQLQSTECKIELDKNNITINVTAKKQLLAENIIEELMLLANFCVAKFAKKHKLPILFRIHEKPSLEKINNLKTLLQNLNISTSKIKTNLKIKTLANLLEQNKNSELFTIINKNILRTMAKAKYSTNALLHFGLNLKTYTHFTSPIRRYCDLLVHRILTFYIYENKSPKQLHKKYQTFLEKTTKIINNTEKNAMKIERNCEEYYKAEFMKNKIGLNFNAIISGCTKFGLFVQLENTIEGFIKIETLNDHFEFDGFCRLICKKKNKTYTIGQKITVVCVSVNVNLKSINFEITNQA